MYATLEESTLADNKKKALDTAIAQIERSYGKGAIMRLGDSQNLNVEAISTGSLTLDAATGIGGFANARDGWLLEAKRGLRAHEARR